MTVLIEEFVLGFCIGIALMLLVVSYVHHQGVVAAWKAWCEAQDLYGKLVCETRSDVLNQSLPALVEDWTEHRISGETSSTDELERLISRRSDARFDSYFACKLPTTEVRL